MLESDMQATWTITSQVLTDRLAALAQALAARNDALALLALGSVGRETARLDAWSDLDFFVLVADGAKTRYLTQLDWLADAYPLAWHFQNTADGHKALMADGVFCEFAVFETHELSHIPYAPGRFVWRRHGVEESLASPRQNLPAKHDASWLLGEALSNLMVGLQRHARGERLAARCLTRRARSATHSMWSDESKRAVLWRHRPCLCGPEGMNTPFPLL